MQTYRCIYCGQVTGSDEDALEAQAMAMANQEHGEGFCVPSEMGEYQWCEGGRHWADVARSQMRKIGGVYGQWHCPGHMPKEDRA